MTASELMAEEAAIEHVLDPKLVFSIIDIESNWDPLAVRFEPAWKYFYTPVEYAEKNRITYETERNLQAMSFGLMQVMGGVCRELGYKGSLLRVAAEPGLALSLGCAKLKMCMKKYGKLEEAVAAYNAGSPRYTSGGMFLNQRYVDKVFSRIRERGGI